MRTTAHWICAMIGLFSGGIAYLNMPTFLQINPAHMENDVSDILKKAGEFLWSITIAGATTLSALAVKHWWDIRGKRTFGRWIKKKGGK